MTEMPNIINGVLAIIVLWGTLFFLFTLPGFFFLGAGLVGLVLLSVGVFKYASHN